MIGTNLKPVILRIEQHSKLVHRGEAWFGDVSQISELVRAEVDKRVKALRELGQIETGYFQLFMLDTWGRFIDSEDLIA